MIATRMAARGTADALVLEGMRDVSRGAFVPLIGAQGRSDERPAA